MTYPLPAALLFPPHGDNRIATRQPADPQLDAWGEPISKVSSPAT